MTRLNAQERDLIEAIRNFRNSKGRMRFQTDFYNDIHQRVDNLLFGEEGF